MTTGSKDVPGWQTTDIVALGGAFSSGIVLAGLWAAVGLGAGLFNERSDSGWFGGVRIILTALVVGPLWLGVEIGCGWPPGGVVSGGDFAAYGVGGMTGVVYTVVTGSVGLGSIMWISNGWR